MTHFLDVVRSYDYQWFLYLHNLNLDRPWIHDLFYFFSRYGILLFFLSMIYLIWNKRINAFLATLLSVAFAGVVDFIIYLFWQRPQPFIAHTNLFSPDVSNLRVDLASFPSSHTLIAFAVATTVFLYGHRRLGLLLYLIAILVAISRTAEGLNYPSDSIGGALFGIAAGIVAFVAIHNTEDKWA